MSHHPEQAVKAATNRTEPRQHEAVDDAVRDHAGRSVRAWCGCRVEEFALDYVNLLTFGNAATIAAASGPPRLCGLQVRRTISSMHPSLRDQVVRYGLAVEPMPTTRPSQLLIETARALATAEAMLVSCVNVCAADIAQHSRGGRASGQRQPLRC